jgi:hypothetical protein
MYPWRSGTFLLAGNGPASISWDADSASRGFVWRESLSFSPTEPHIIHADDGISWAHEICNEDNEERAIVVASMNEMAYVLQAWLPLIVWQQVDAPNYQKGYITVVFLAALLITTAFTIRFLWARELLRCVDFEGAGSENY